MEELSEHKDELALTAKFFEIMQKYYPNIKVLLEQYGVIINPTPNEHLDNLVLSINNALNLDENNNIIIQVGNNRYTFNNIVAFCDFTELVEFINPNTCAFKDGYYIRQMILNLIRYHKKALTDTEKSEKKIKHIIIKIGDKYFFDTKRLEKEINKIK